MILPPVVFLGLILGDVFHIGQLQSIRVIEIVVYTHRENMGEEKYCHDFTK